MSIEVINSAEKALELMEKVGKQVPVYWTVFGLKIWPYRWLWISEKNGVVTVYSATDSNSHFLLFGPCYCIDINAQGEQYRSILPGVWKSAISMWPVRNKEEAESIWNYVVGQIDKAHKQHCG